MTMLYVQQIDTVLRRASLNFLPKYLVVYCSFYKLFFPIYYCCLLGIKSTLLQMRLLDGVFQVHHVLLDFIQVIHFVMMQTTMLNAILIMELVVTNPGQCGPTSVL